MEIRLILLDIIGKGLDNKQAIDYAKSKGYSEATIIAYFMERGVRFPVKDFDDHNPSPRRKEQLQDLSLRM